VADKLFLLRPSFQDPAAGAGDFYCPFCAAISGVLTYFPQLRSKIHVHEVDFPRPRPAVAALLGPDHPGCPLLVLDSESASPTGIAVRQAANGQRYIADSIQIARYLSATYGIASPHP
jgi:Protein of unknown function (DUF3088)